MRQANESGDVVEREARQKSGCPAVIRNNNPLKRRPLYQDGERQVEAESQDVFPPSPQSTIASRQEDRPSCASTTTTIDLTH
jgi:hypothetical protein